MAIWGYGNVWRYKGNVVGCFLKYRLAYIEPAVGKLLGNLKSSPVISGGIVAPKLTINQARLLKLLMKDGAGTDVCWYSYVFWAPLLCPVGQRHQKPGCALVLLVCL